MRFTATPRDADTVEVRAADGFLFLTFTCDRDIAENDETCWLYFERDPGDARPALEHLQEAWPNIDNWGQWDEVPELVLARRAS